MWQVVDFNSHALVERDLAHIMSQGIIAISTHTLTWSVTPCMYGDFQNFRISTHTLTWSVKHKFVTIYRRIFISTHTLTWSVTYSGFATGTNYQDFNSHAHVERDLSRMIDDNIF